MHMLHFIKSITENKDKSEIRQDKLKFDKNELEPVMSEDTVKYHYDGLAAKYSERYNKGEGDPDFNYGGAIKDPIGSIWIPPANCTQYIITNIKRI